MLEKVKIDKLVHGGQGLGTLLDGRRVFVWNALPGETVEVRLTKSKKTHAEGLAINIIEPSVERIEPLEPAMYMSTSPWQILAQVGENEWKQKILEETFVNEKLTIAWADFASLEERFGYRNKMEYNFWWDNDKGRVDIALHQRGSHQKVVVEGSALASDAINAAGKKLVAFLNTHKIGGRQLKSAVIRSQRDGGVVICLYVIDESVAELPWAELGLLGVHVYYSNPKSPASVATKELAKVGEEYMTDIILGQQFCYAPEGFFQVNIPIYEQALSEIQNTVGSPQKVVDLYSGVGSIGMSMNAQEIVCVEADQSSVMQARLNAAESPKNVEIVHGESEKVLGWITGDAVVIVDPPRAGLHAKVVERLLSEKPKGIVYLSCNPSTQARDVKMLTENGTYKVTKAQGFNFFPATPHIESLIVLTIK